MRVDLLNGVGTQERKVRRRESKKLRTRVLIDTLERRSLFDGGGLTSELPEPPPEVTHISVYVSNASGDIQYVSTAARAGKSWLDTIKTVTDIVKNLTGSFKDVAPGDGEATTPPVTTTPEQQPPTSETPPTATGGNPTGTHPPATQPPSPAQPGHNWVYVNGQWLHVPAGTVIIVVPQNPPTPPSTPTPPPGNTDATTPTNPPTAQPTATPRTPGDVYSSFSWTKWVFGGGHGSVGDDIWDALLGREKNTVRPQE